ncbi:MAG: uroporphyrinogen decarboxylase family protein [Anaerolineae bacterium]
MQTSQEVIHSAIEFTVPDRLPVIFDAFGVSDVKSISWNQVGTGDHAQKHTYDEWGCGWSRSDVKNMGLVNEHPLDSWDKLDTFRWPDPNNPTFYQGMERHFEHSEGRYLLTGIFMLLFERMHTLRGYENTLADLYLEWEKIELLADRIVEYDLAIIHNISSRFPGMIHGFSFSDDWGTEQMLMIQPRLWQEFFKPRYKRIFDACHQAGWHVWMHSCGKVNDIIGDLIDIGLDVINLQQPTLLGIEEVGKQFAGRLCFLSLCDIQKTLPYKNQAEIAAEARLLIDCWGTPDGGFILGDYGDGEAIDVPLWKKQVMFDAFMQADRWKR